VKHEEILASVSVLVLAGVIVYATKVGLITTGTLLSKQNKYSANQQSDISAVNAAGGSSQLVSGPSIYMSNTPWPYWPPVGNVIPPNSNQVVGTSDFLGFIAS
jgi:hypothetical protein